MCSPCHFIYDVFCARHKEREKVFRQVTYFFIRIGILVCIAFSFIYYGFGAIGIAMNSIPTVAGVITAVISLIVCACPLVQRRKEYKLNKMLEHSKGNLSSPEKD